MQQWQAAPAVANLIAERLATPADARRLHGGDRWWPQSLAYGSVGIALLHIERARAGLASWSRAHAWLADATTQPAVGGVDSHLFYGAPALAFALNVAADRPRRYDGALATLDEQVISTVRARVRRGSDRIGRQKRPTLAEFDTLRGLAGLCALLLQRECHHVLARDVLIYLVALTEPVKVGNELLPGWWSDVAPSGRLDPDFPGGHANFGMAHGIGGPLAALSLAWQRGVRVPGQCEAIERICAWLDAWRQTGPSGHWWPYWITREQLRTGDPGTGPGAPSWCYGTPGLARAQQLAGLALGDTARQRMAEAALLAAITDLGQLRQTGGTSLCHGFAGLLHMTQAVGADSITPELCEVWLPNLLNALVAPVPDAEVDGPHQLADRLLDPTRRHGGVGLLEGAAGVALALHTTQTGTPPLSGWNACLLLS